MAQSSFHFTTHSPFTFLQQHFLVHLCLAPHLLLPRPPYPQLSSPSPRQTSTIICPYETDFPAITFLDGGAMSRCSASLLLHLLGEHPHIGLPLCEAAPLFEEESAPLLNNDQIWSTKSSCTGCGSPKCWGRRCLGFSTGGCFGM
jgi:hypothetical protein